MFFSTDPSQKYRSMEPNANGAELIINPYTIHDKALALHYLYGFSNTRVVEGGVGRAEIKVR